MKKRISICFLSTVFVLLLFRSSAQNIHATVDTVIHVECNHFKLGAASVSVTNVIHPPYTFQWSNGLMNTGQVSSTAQNLEVGTYTVTITDSQDGDLATVTVNIAELECEVIPEDLFTPNGDGYNDSWQIDKSQFFPDAWILIYNRLGQKVFEHSGLYEPWEGKDLFGRQLPDAAYYYVFYPNKSDKGKLVKGSVSIIR